MAVAWADDSNMSKAGKYGTNDDSLMRLMKQLHSRNLT